jgi:hypothetical protein
MDKRTDQVLLIIEADGCAAHNGVFKSVEEAGDSSNKV